MRTIFVRHWLRSLVTYDFSPEFSAKVRLLFYNPLGVLILAGLAALLCGLVLDSHGFVLFSGVLAVITLGVIWPWLSVRGLSGTIGFDRARVTEGEPVDVRLMLQNRLPWPVWGLAVRGGFGGPAEEPLAGIGTVPRWRAVRARWSFVPLRRGAYPVTSPRITSGFPFGLWQNRRQLVIQSKLIVWPHLYAVGPVPPVSGARQVEGNVSRSKVGTNGDVLGVRPYRRGDSPRRIHWAQSARHDRLIVCELQSNSRPVIQIVLDVEPAVHVGSGPNSSREWAIRIAASLANGWLEDGAQVGLAWGKHEIPVASGHAQNQSILDSLATIPDDVSQPLAEVLACPRCRGFRDGLQVIVTTDRTHAHDGCGACEAEDQRWIVLQTAGFTSDSLQAACGRCPAAWLNVANPDAVPTLLRGGWQEARHGS